MPRPESKLLLLYQAVKDKRGPDSSITAGWWYSFKSRHPDLSIRTAEQLAYSRAVAQDQTVLDHYFELLERTLVENELIGLPSRIFNVDESGFPLQGHQSTIIAEKGCKHPTRVSVLALKLLGSIRWTLQCLLPSMI